MDYKEKTANIQEVFDSLTPENRHFVLGLLQVLASDQESGDGSHQTEY